MFLHIALGLLGIGSQAVAHQLVGQYPGYPFDGKGKAYVLKGRSMPHFPQPLNQSRHLLVGHGFFQFLGPNGRIAQMGAHGNGPIRFRRIAD